jgi:hypothetical protein
MTDEQLLFYALGFKYKPLSYYAEVLGWDYQHTRDIMYQLHLVYKALWNIPEDLVSVNLNTYQSAIDWIDNHIFKED